MKTNKKNKTKIVEFRITADEERKLQKRADSVGMTRSDYLRYLYFKTDFNDLKRLIKVEKEKLESIKKFNRTISNIAMALNIINISADNLLRREIDDFRRQLIEAREMLLKLLKSVKVKVS